MAYIISVRIPGVAFDLGLATAMTHSDAVRIGEVLSTLYTDAVIVSAKGSLFELNRFRNGKEVATLIG